MKFMIMAAVLAVATSVLAQNPTDAGSQPATPGAATAMGGGMTEANVLAMLTAINDHEIAEGKLAVAKAHSTGVRRFARMMVHDHGQSNRQVAAAAKRLGVKPEADDDVNALKQAAQGDLKDVEGLRGAAFDKAYVDQMVDGHRQALKKLDQAMSASPTRSAEFSNLLSETRKVVRHHLQSAEKLQASLGQ